MSDLSKSFAMQKYGVAFNWWAFLQKHKYTNEELKEAVDLSVSWVTCACGEQCAVIPRDETSGVPVDMELRDLGLEFCENISGMREVQRDGIEREGQTLDDYKVKAKKVLMKIEARAAELIPLYQDGPVTC